jgi:hypothetical protein
MLDTSKLTQTALCGAHWLVVDPDPVRARTTAFALMEAGALVTTISSIRAATEWLDTQEQPLDGVAVDVEVCRRNEGFVSSLRWRESPCFALALSETADQRAIREMVRSTAIEFLFGNDGLANLVAAATRVTIVTRRMRDPAAFARSSEVPAPPPPSTLPHKALEAAGLGYDVDATVGKRRFCATSCAVASIETLRRSWGSQRARSRCTPRMCAARPAFRLVPS